MLKLRALQATLSGRLSQAQLSTQGRIEAGSRRYAVQLAAEGGRVAGPAALSDSAWQGLLKQFSVVVEDPAMGAGAWRLTTRGTVPLKWTPTRADAAVARVVFESGAGEALLIAPPGMASTAAGTAAATSPAPSQALLAWQPVLWRPGELVTAGKITGLPMAWIELLAGPQMAGAGLSGKLLFDGQWDATLGDTLRLNASLARSSGELSFRGSSSNATGGTSKGAITLGKRFSRYFYAAYERSISGALGTRYVFYDLSQRFTVRAQAGQQSALDLIFTLPYDCGDFEGAASASAYNSQSPQPLQALPP